MQPGNYKSSTRTFCELLFANKKEQREIKDPIRDLLASEISKYFAKLELDPKWNWLLCCAAASNHYMTNRETMGNVFLRV